MKVNLISMFTIANHVSNELEKKVLKKVKKN